MTVNEAAHECPKCGSSAVPTRRNPKDPMDLSNPRWFCQECNKFLKEDYTEKTPEHKFVPVKGQTGCAKCGYASGHHPNAQQLKQIQNEAVSIRPSTYRDKEGFTVYGDQAKIFTPSRDKAERLAAVLRNMSGADRSEAVDNILKESWKVEVIADNSGKWATNSMRYASKEEAEAAGDSLMMRWTAVRDMRVTETNDPVYPAIKESVNLLVKLRAKDYVGAQVAFARLMQEKVNVLLAEERRGLLVNGKLPSHNFNGKPCPNRPCGRITEDTEDLMRGATSTYLLGQIRAGDRVTIVNRFGQERSGKAVMRGPAGWVLNMGGPHGTPGIASDSNIIKVNSRAKQTNAWGLVKEAKDFFVQKPNGELIKDDTVAIPFPTKSAAASAAKKVNGTVGYWDWAKGEFVALNEWSDYDGGENDFDNDHPFANPGGKSALRASGKGNPRNLPCPTCKEPNRLTRKDKSLGYQCDQCADRDEGGGY